MGYRKNRFSVGSGSVSYILEVYPMAGGYYFVVRDKKDYKMVHSSDFFKTKLLATKRGKEYIKKLKNKR